jgi:hypothetical protein
MQLHSKSKGHGVFAARQKILSSGLTQALIMKLVYPRPPNTRCKTQELAAIQLLPARVYSGLMVRADEFDDDDPGAYIERDGWRFRTLFKHRHSRETHVLESGALFHVGGAMRMEFGSRELGEGWEVCPPDDVSIAVCTQYSWQSPVLALGDRMRHATLACKCRVCAKQDSSQQPRQPHTDGYASKMTIERRRVTVEGVDVLVRRRACRSCVFVGVPLAAAACAACSQSKSSVAPPAAAEDPVRDLANLLARCCLAQASPQQRGHIEEFLGKNQ